MHNYVMKYVSQNEIFFSYIVSYFSYDPKITFWCDDIKRYQGYIVNFSNITIVMILKFYPNIFLEKNCVGVSFVCINNATQLVFGKPIRSQIYDEK